MTRFLDHLGLMARAVAAPHAARPSLPSPLAQAASGGFVEEAAAAEASRTANDAEPREKSVTRQVTRLGDEPLRSLPEAPQPVRPALPDLPSEPALSPPDPGILARVSVQSAQLQGITAPVRAANPAPLRHVVAPSQRPGLAPIVVSTERSQGMNSLAPTLASPLSPAAVAGRLQTQMATPAPVIHVTIDRIDVREAPAPKPTPPDRRPRVQPTLSLADYLNPDRGAKR